MNRSALIFFLFLAGHLLAIERMYDPKYRVPHFPYITGDAFRSYSDHIFDETKKTFDPQKVKKGDTVFVKADMIDQFFLQYHARIAVPYILITHNSDQEISKKYHAVLEDSKIIAWFAQNVIEAHPKLHPIPIGLENNYISTTKIGILEEAQRKCLGKSKQILLYQNFATVTYPSERTYVKNLFGEKLFCKCASNLRPDAYFQDVALSEFVLSPRGNGIDCIRTWECLYLGAIPVIRSSALDPLYEDLPVLIIKKWTEIDAGFLSRQYQQISQKKCNLDKLSIFYWFALIDSYKTL